LLPLAVLVVGGALANGRRWLSFLVRSVLLLPWHADPCGTITHRLAL
jgi:hypothetical protein